MATSTSSSTQTVKIQTPDPFFSSLQEPKETLFKQTDKSFEAFYPKWETEYETLEQFQIDVRNRGHNFQKETVKPIPKRDELEKEREGYLTKYWAFRGTYEKIDIYCSELKKRIEFLTPQVRTYYEEERLKNDQPELLERIKQHEEICKGYIRNLQEFSDKVNTLKGKFYVCIHTDTYSLNWALQRFCQIVDKDGKPLNVGTRLVDNLTNPVIPKPKGSSSLSNSTTSAPQQQTGAPSEKSKEATTSQGATPQQTSAPTEKSKEPSTSQAATQQPQTSAPSEKSKEATTSQVATQQPQTSAPTEKSKEPSTSQVAPPPQPQPQAPSSQNKEASTTSPATTSGASGSNGSVSEQSELFVSTLTTENELYNSTNESNS